LKKKRDKVSIITVNYNGKNILKKCLESIKNKTLYENYEILVVDNNSTDGSIKMLQKFFPEIKLIQNPKNYGFSKGNNIGIRETLKHRTDYILLLNNDTEVTENWLKSMIKISDNDKRIGIVGPKLILPNESTQKNCYSYKYGLTKKFAPNKTQDVDCVSGACMLIKNCVIQKIGLLDEGFNPLYFEDIDYCFRVKKSGFRIVYTTKSKVYHHKGATTRKVDWSYEAYHISRIKFFLKHFPISWLVVRLLIEPWNLMKGLKEGKLKILLSVYLKIYRSRFKY